MPFPSYLGGAAACLQGPCWRASCGCRRGQGWLCWHRGPAAAPAAAAGCCSPECSAPAALSGPGSLPPGGSGRCSKGPGDRHPRCELKAEREGLVALIQVFLSICQILCDIPFSRTHCHRRAQATNTSVTGRPLVLCGVWHTPQSGLFLKLPPCI